MTSGLGHVVRSRRTNAVLGWLVVGFVAVVAVIELLTDEVAWGLFMLAVVAISVVPAVVYRRAEAMLPWELLLLAAVPALVRAFAVGHTVGGLTLSGRVSTYVAVAAIALVVAVELDVFTSVRMNQPFAVFFVVVATTAAAGVWALVQWASDVFLGTQLLVNRPMPEAAIEEALMWDFVAATVAGAVAGVVFVAYFRRYYPAAERVPSDVVSDAGRSEVEKR